MTRRVYADRVLGGAGDINGQGHGHTDQAGGGVDVKVGQGGAVPGDLTRHHILKTT